MNVEVTFTTGSNDVTISNYDQEFSYDTTKTRALSIAGLLGDSVGQALLALTGKEGIGLPEILERFEGALSDALR